MSCFECGDSLDKSDGKPINGISFCNECYKLQQKTLTRFRDEQRAGKSGNSRSRPSKIEDDLGTFSSFRKAIPERKRNEETNDLILKTGDLWKPRFKYGDEPQSMPDKREKTRSMTPESKRRPIAAEPKKLSGAQRSNFPPNLIASRKTDQLSFPEEYQSRRFMANSGKLRTSSVSGKIKLNKGSDSSRETSPNIIRRKSGNSKFEDFTNPKFGRSIEKEKKPLKITCDSCVAEKDSCEFDPMPNHRCTTEQRKICEECIYEFIQASFKTLFNPTLHCPDASCTSDLGFQTIQYVLKKYGGSQLFERYDRFLVLHTLEHNDDFIWCSNPKCQAGQLHEGGKDANIVTCRKCRTKTCFIHRSPWHSGKTCDEYNSEVKGEDRATLKWLNQNTKQCPKCTHCIEKNQGCDHMTCIICKHEFCWFCLADFDPIRREGNHRHMDNCKHYFAYVRR